MPLKLPSKANILIIRLSSLGDVVLATAVPPVLKAAYPQSRLTFLTKKPYGDLLALAPDLDEVISFGKGDGLWSLSSRLKKDRFDLVIDLHGNLRSLMVCGLMGSVPCLRVPRERWRRLALVWFKLKTSRPIPSVRERCGKVLSSMGLKPGRLLPRLSLNPTALEAQKRHGLEGLKKPSIGFCLSSRHATKRWTAESALTCMNTLKTSSGGNLVLLGFETDERLALEGHPALDLVGKTSLVELAGVIGSLSVLVSVDSGPLHVAEALGIPVVSLFGPTVPDFGFAPVLAGSTWIEESLPCRPCSLHGGERCPLGHHRCMEEISADRVARSALAVLSHHEA